MKINPSQEEWQAMVTAGGDGNERRARLNKCISGLERSPLPSALEAAGVPDAHKVARLCTPEARKKKMGNEDVLCYVYAYTFGFSSTDKIEDTPYFKINRGLLIGTFESLNQVKHLIHGLLLGLRSLPYKFFPILYRGIKNQVVWMKNEVQLWPCFTSTTKKFDCAMKFLNCNENGYLSGTLIQIKDAWGYDLTSLPMVKGEDEVLIEPGIKVLVEDFTPSLLSYAHVCVIEGSGDILLDEIPRHLPEETDEVEEVDGLYHEFNTLMRLKEYKEAESVIQSLCVKGNMKAIVKYGLMLIRGECFERNVDTGFKLLSKGKEHRDGEGLYELGRCYEMGIGTEKNEIEGMKNYLLSYLHGYPIEMDLLIKIKRDLSQDIIRELEDDFGHVNKMVRGEVPQYKCIYGMCCMIGLFYDENTEEGHRILKKLCERGNKNSQYCLGYCYENGIGVDKNFDEAFKLYKESAEQGNPFAQYSVGYCYTYGVGVDKNPGDAFKWYKLSAEQGNENAGKALKSQRHNCNPFSLGVFLLVVLSSSLLLTACACVYLKL